MWLAACLWAKKGVEMGVGWGRTPFSKRREPGGGEGGFPKYLEIPELVVGQGEGSTVGDPRLQTWGNEWVSGDG